MKTRRWRRRGLWFIRFIVLVALLLECVAWPLSLFTYTNLHYKHTWFPEPGRCKQLWVWVWSSSGTLSFGYLFEDFDVSTLSTMPVPGGDFSDSVWFSRPAIFGEERGFRYWDSGWNNVMVGAPHWFITPACFVLASFLWLPVLRSVRRATRGHCRTCGYDLRATRDRCPKCGAVPAAA